MSAKATQDYVEEVLDAIADKRARHWVYGYQRSQMKEVLEIVAGHYPDRTFGSREVLDHDAWVFELGTRATVGQLERIASRRAKMIAAGKRWGLPV